LLPFRWPPYESTTRSPEAERTVSDDAVSRHTILNVRAQLRRRGLTAKVRAAIEAQMPRLEAQAQARGLWPVRGWRAYPGPDTLLGTIRAGADGELLEWLPGGRHRTHSAWDCGRQDPPNSSTDRHALSGGDQLAELEVRIAAAMARREWHGKSQNHPNSQLRRQPTKASPAATRTAVSSQRTTIEARSPI